MSKQQLQSRPRLLEKLLNPRFGLLKTLGIKKTLWENHQRHLKSPRILGCYPKRTRGSDHRHPEYPVIQKIRGKMDVSVFTGTPTKN